MTFEPSKVKLDVNYLGKSQWSSDPYFTGKIDDFQIYTKVLTGSELWAKAGGDIALAPVFNATEISLTDAVERTNYAAESLTASVTYSGTDTLSFTKISGPEWLIIAENGDISGVPGKYDLGENVFKVRVSSSDGISDDTTITVNVANINDKPQWKDSDPIRILFGAYENINTNLTDYVDEADVDDTLTFTVESAPDWC